MFTLLNHQVHEIRNIISRTQQSRSKGVSYARALQLLYVTLRKTQEDLETIYFSYVLKPMLQAQDSIVISCVYMMSQMIKSKDQNTPRDILPSLHCAM